MKIKQAARLRIARPRFLILIGILLFALVADIQTISAASISAASEALERSQNVVNFMDAHNLSTARAQDLLDESKLYFEEKQYAEVVSLETEIQKLKDTAFLLTDTITESEELLVAAKKRGYDSNETATQIEQSREAFLIGNYEFADRTLIKVNADLSAYLIRHLTALHTLSIELSNRSAELGLSVGSEVAATLEEALEGKEVASTEALQSQLVLLNRSLSSLERAVSSLAQAKSSNYSVSRMEDHYSEARIALELSLFDKAIAESEHVAELYAEAQEVQAAILQSHTRIAGLQKKGISIERIQKQIETAIQEFESEDYEESKTILTKVDEELKKIETSSLLSAVVLKEKRNRVLAFVTQFWYAVIIFIVLLLGGSIVLYQLLKKRLLSYRLSTLQKEEPVLIALIKKDQTEYFKDKTMSKETYESRMDKHHERLLYVKEALPELKRKVKEMEESSEVNKK